jgi:hypothetical protein
MNRFKVIVLSATSTPSLSGRKVFSANPSAARFVWYGPIAFVSLDGPMVLACCESVRDANNR